MCIRDSFTMALLFSATSPGSMAFRMARCSLRKFLWFISIFFTKVFDRSILILNVNIVQLCCQVFLDVYKRQGQGDQSHRSSRMKLLCGNSNLRTKSELKSIGKTCRDVYKRQAPAFSTALKISYEPAGANNSN